jgi:uncharacterized protein YbjT (DUF2867 family)
MPRWSSSAQVKLASRLSSAEVEALESTPRMSRRVLVSGGTGFVGGALVPKLVEDGYSVRVLTRGKSRTLQIAKPDVEIVSGDVTKPNSLPKALEGIEVVIHLVGIIAERGESSFEKVHYRGTVNLASVARDAGIKRFVHMSALGSGPEAVSRYHRTKFQAEQHLPGSGLDFTIFRPSVILGPGSEFLRTFVRMMRWSPLLVIPKVRQGRLQPIWLGDVVDCFRQAIEKGETSGRTYELGGPEKLSLGQLLGRIAKSLGREKPIVEVPMPLVRFGVSLFQALLPNPPVTREQLTMLQEDNTCEMEEVLRVFDLEYLPLDQSIARSLKGSA